MNDDANEVLDNLDFQQEKDVEMQQTSTNIDCCAICGEPLRSKDMVYQRPDGELVHERCMLDSISDECTEYADYTIDRREKISIEEIF